MPRLFLKFKLNKCAIVTWCMSDDFLVSIFHLKRMLTYSEIHNSTSVVKIFNY